MTKERTYDEMMRLEDGNVGGFWGVFQRGDATIEEMASFLLECQRAHDHRRAVFYAEKLAGYYESIKSPGIAKSFRRSAENQQRAYEKSLEDPSNTQTF